MAIIKSGASTDVLTIDPSSKAARVTLYDSAGNEISSLPIFERTDRTSALVYSYSEIDVAGQAAANNFFALSNPAASGKRIALIHIDHQVYSVAAAATKNSWNLFHCTAEASAGTDTSANIHRVLSSQAAPVAVVRNNNPTITSGKLIQSFAAGGDVTAAGIYSTPTTVYNPNNEEEQSIILPGEGIAFRQTVAGDTDQTYCFRVVWMEYTP